MQHSTNFRVNNFKDILADKGNVNDHNNENHHDNKDNGNNDFDDYKNDDNNDDDDVCIALAYFDRKLNRSQYTHCENLTVLAFAMTQKSLQASSLFL